MMQSADALDLHDELGFHAFRSSNATHLIAAGPQPAPAPELVL
jgi:hypothetical protein